MYGASWYPMGIPPFSGKGALGTTAALVLALIVIAIATQSTAAQIGVWIGLAVVFLLAVFALKVLGSRVLGGLTFGR